MPVVNKSASEGSLSAGHLYAQRQAAGRRPQGGPVVVNPIAGVDNAFDGDDDTDGEDASIRRVSTMDELRRQQMSESEFEPLPRSYRHDSEDDSHLLLGLTGGLTTGGLTGTDRGGAQIELTGPTGTAEASTRSPKGTRLCSSDFGVHNEYRDGKPRPYFRGWCHGIVTLLIIPIIVSLGEHGCRGLAKPAHHHTWPGSFHAQSLLTLLLRVHPLGAMHVNWWLYGFILLKLPIYAASATYHLYNFSSLASLRAAVGLSFAALTRLPPASGTRIHTLTRTYLSHQPRRTWPILR